ncbi:hypothetical protein DTO212C5_4637 [Paecilomyces variotii]|nr:hypothetical protein DTO212C5_4637 [Paecilomyces variotii]
MSHLLHKVKDAVTGDKHSDNPSSTNAGPHGSNTANKVDPRIDSDRDNRAAGTYGSSNTHGGGSSDTYGSNTYGSGSSNYGPHDSNTANKLDPRVDSDRDNRATGAYGGSSNTYGSGSSNYGPHDSNLANKVDPRVDSDRDNRAAGGYGGSSNAYGSGSSNYGPHDSNLANKADPRVDSDLDNRGTTGGYGSLGAGAGYGSSNTYGSSDNYGSGSSNYGPHGSNVANKLDPRFDSDRDNRARHQQLGGGGALGSSSYNTPGSGNTRKTAGPHDSDFANKLDPRVDSDLDNSRTVGGNVTNY